MYLPLVQYQSNREIISILLSLIVVVANVNMLVDVVILFYFILFGFNALVRGLLLNIAQKHHYMRQASCFSCNGVSLSLSLSIARESCAWRKHYLRLVQEQEQDQNLNLNRE